MLRLLAHLARASSHGLAPRAWPAHQEQLVLRLRAMVARALVTKAKAGGVQAELKLGRDMIHGYAAFGAATPRAEEALCAIEGFLSRA